MKNLITIVRQEAGQFAAGLFCLLALIWFYGCHSKVVSLTDPTKKVTRPVIKTELETFIKIAEIRYAELDRQDAFKQAVANAVLLTAESGSLNPMGVIAILISSLGIGATVDNVKLRAKNKKLTGKTP